MKPHPDTDRLRRALERCLPQAIAWKGEFFRSASPKYANKDDIITGAGSKAAGARWNPPGGFHTVYGSLDVETAIAEALQHFRYYGLPVSKAMPRVIVALETKVRLAYDLGLQGLVVPSAALKGGSNLIVYPANLDPPKSWLRILNRDELPRKA
jgi:RES domain-containing protein